VRVRRRVRKFRSHIAMLTQLLQDQVISTAFDLASLTFDLTRC